MNTKTLTSFSSTLSSTLRSWMNNPNTLAKRKIAWFGLSIALLLAAGGTFVMLERKYPEITFTREDRLKVLDQQAQPYYDQAKRSVGSALTEMLKTENKNGNLSLKEKIMSWLKAGKSGMLS